ncbi:Negative regulator of mitotic exit [Ceratobasidium sp. UAMH 11750]|nr:Negative regulator of mitotic exit [Ceratobasidium sp. UAMH 11750]
MYSTGPGHLPMHLTEPGRPRNSSNVFERLKNNLNVLARLRTERLSCTVRPARPPADALGAKDINRTGYVRAGSAVPLVGWAVLARAANAGFLRTEQEVLGDWGAGEGLVNVVVGLKQQQARSQSTFAAQIRSASHRVVEAERVKTAALQEAAFYRAKFVAYKSGPEGDLTRLEHE